MNTRKKNRIQIVLPSVTLALSLLWLGFYYLFRDRQEWMHALCKALVRPFHLFAARISAILPFSLGELLCYGAVLWVLYSLVGVIIALFSLKKDKNQLCPALLRLFAFPVLVGALFTLFWGVYYSADNFPQESGLQDAPISTTDLEDVTARFIALCNSYGEQVERDEKGCFCIDRQAVFSRSATLYENISAQLPLALQPAVPCKGVSKAFSYGMSVTGFTGFFCPYTGEANVNTHMPDLMLPATISHELAHQRGVPREDYANFVGILAALESGELDYAYSGAVLGYIYLGNALYQADYDRWQALYSTISPAVRTDLNAHNTYWQQFEGKAEKVSETLYESLLESVGEKRGMASYGVCVDLLVQWYSQEKP